MGGTLPASFDRGSGAFLGYPKGLLLYFFTGAGAELPVLWPVMPAIQALLGDGPYAIIPSPGFQTQLKLA
jgi:hypothetical protein